MLYVFNLSGSSNDIEKYKKYRNKFTHLKEKSKHNYYRNCINGSKHNMKLLWKTINDIAKYKKLEIIS